MNQRSWYPPETPDRFLCLLNSPVYCLLARLYGALVDSTFDHWRLEGGVPLLLPVTSTAASSPMGLGSDSIPVQATIQGRETYLTDSMQFLLEYGCRLTRASTFYIAASFRGEMQDPSHLSEFFHSEGEIIGKLEDVISMVERYVLRLTRRILGDLGADLESAGFATQHLRALCDGGQPWPRIEFDTAVMLLGENDTMIRTSPDGRARSLTRAGEQELLLRAGPWVWLTSHDRLSVPFYQAVRPDNPQRARNADLLLGLGEVVGAGERHVTGDELRRALIDHDIEAQPYDWYVRMKDAVPLRTAGFGLGIERFMAWVLAHDDIRELQIIPREFGKHLVP